MSKKRFTEDEVHAIFEQAARRQEEARHAEEASRAGLSLEELQRIGAESGIDPAHVAAVATALAQRGGVPAPVEREAFLGIPTRLRRTRYLDAPVTDTMWEQVVPALRDAFGGDGVSSQIGRVREWMLRPGKSSHDRAVKVTFTPEGEGTRVEIEQVMRSTTLGFFWGSASMAVTALLFGALFLFGGSDPDTAILTGIFATLAVLFTAGSLIGLRTYGGRQEERFAAALDRLALIARDATPGETRGLPEAAPRLDPGSLPDAPELELEPARRAARRDRS